MDIYLPIAGQSVNALFIVVLGFVVGLLSGMFGIGGGFLTTPLLIFYGIPPSVAVASATTQITGASVTGAMAHMRRGGADMQMAVIMIVGGLYVLLLGYIGYLMLKDALIAIGVVKVGAPKQRPRHNRWVAALPLRW